MDKIIDFINGLGIDFDTFWKAGLILLIGTILISVFGRFIFGKRSALNNAASSAFGIIFIYAISVVLRSLGSQYSGLLTPLPFVSIQGDTLTFFNFIGAHYTSICAEVLNMIVLAFLVNLADGWLPRGKNIFIWVFFRCLTVVIAYLLHLIVAGLLARFVPEGLAIYAPVVLVAILIVLLLTGALKILVGAALTTINPIIGGLYTFFFATIIGKQVTKAVLTTAILSGVVIALHYADVSAITIASSALIAYVPLLLILVVLWFIASKFL